MKRTKQSGFTLIEIMIVVAIIAIIGAVAYPSYIDQIRKARRSDAQVGLQQMAQLQESYFSRNYSYASTLQQLGLPDGDSPENFYSLTLTGTPAGCDGTRNNNNACEGFTIVATAQVGKTQAKDSKCARFVIDQVGRKTATNSDSTPGDTSAECW